MTTGGASTIRRLATGDVAAFADLYTTSAARPGHEKFEAMTSERAAHLLDVGTGRRGMGIVCEAAHGIATVAGTVRQELSGQIECFGPYMPGPFDEMTGRTLLSAFTDECERAGLVPTLWLDERDTDRRSVVDGIGWRRTATLRWLRHPTPIASAGISRFRSRLRIGDGRSDLDAYRVIYNEGFAHHVGDCEATADDIAFKLADPLHRHSTFKVAYIDDEPVGIIEYWRDRRRDGTHIGWITNVVVRVRHRNNLEVLLGLGSAGATTMAREGAVAGKGLLDPERPALARLYLMLGCTIHEPYVGYAP